MTGVEIRPARAGDAPAIAACVAAAYRHYIARIGKPPAPMLDDYDEVVRRHRVLVAVDGARLVGVLVLIPQSESLLVDNVAVHPDHQGRGLGRELMATSEREARRLGLAALTLYTNERMTEDLALYERLGYAETGRTTEKGYRRVYLRKELTGAANGRQTSSSAWDPQDYERHSHAQESWARDCLARLQPRGDERILDIGCGDGRVSVRLAALVPAGSVLAVDASPEMIGHARERHGGGALANLEFAVADATALAFARRFDLVVSFNCFHWISDQAAALAGVGRALVPGGRTFLHFAGSGNVAGMLAVVDEVRARPAWRAAFAGFAFPWCFPAADSYRALVSDAGLRPDRVELLERRMEHAGPAALAGWLRTTWLPYLDRLPAGRRGAFVDEVLETYLARRPADERGRIWVDAVRLEVEARRPGRIDIT